MPRVAHDLVRHLSLGVCVWLGVAGSVLAAESTSRPRLRWKLRAGQTLYLKSERQSVLSLQVAGGHLDIKQTLRLSARLDVDAARPGGVARLTQRLDRVRLGVKFSTGSEMSYDSFSRQEANVPAPLRRALDRLADETTEITVSDDGRVAKVEPSVPLRKALGKLGKDDVLQIGGIVSVSGLSELAQSWFFVVPKLAPYKGQKWQDSFVTRLTPDVFVSLDNQYRYAGHEEVNGKRFLRFDVEPAASVAEQSTVEVEVWNVNGEGVILFDTKKGRGARTELETRYRLRWQAPDGTTKRGRMQVRLEVRRDEGPQTGSREKGRGKRGR
jgi:hypothetical protein